MVGIYLWEIYGKELIGKYVDELLVFDEVFYKEIFEWFCFMYGVVFVIIYNGIEFI